MSLTEKLIKGKKKIGVASIDVGYRNFCVCAEEIIIPLDSRKDVCLQGNMLFHHNEDFGKLAKNNNEAERQLFIDISDWLEVQSDIWDRCDIILIEQQLKCNKMAPRIQQHVQSWFYLKYRDRKIVEAFSSTHKTQVLKAPKKMTKPERKKWAVEKARQILTQRGDSLGLQTLSETKKADDLGDTLLMIQAWKILNYSHLTRK